MADIFSVRDRTGRTIGLSRERWAHIQKHPRMSGRIDVIAETLRHPLRILPFRHDPAVRLFFRYDKTEKRYVFVSVKYLNGEGFVVTSFYVDKIK